MQVLIAGILSCFITIVLFVARASVEVDHLRSCYFRLNLFIKNETQKETEEFYQSRAEFFCLFYINCFS